MANVSSGSRKFLRVDKHIHLNATELSEAELAKVGRCIGVKEKHPCKNIMFVCLKCGNYGCDQLDIDKCSEQAFKNSRCLHCGSLDNMSPIMADELEKYKQEWDKDYVPGVDES